MKIIILVTSVVFIVIGLLMMIAPNLILSETHYMTTQSTMDTFGGLGLVMIGSALQLIIYFKKP